MGMIKQVHSSPSSKMEQSVASVVINPIRDPSAHAGAPGRAVSEPTRRRCYVCSFCGRECRNAQALGGHMNVHRRERALANQLVELRNNNNNKGAGGGGAAAAAAASSHPPGEAEQDVITHACDMHGGSSSSSSSPPSSQSFASSFVHPWRSLQEACENKALDSVDLDLELRLGLSLPGDCNR